MLTREAKKSSAGCKALRIQRKEFRHRREEFRLRRKEFRLRRKEFRRGKEEKLPPGKELRLRIKASVKPDEESGGRIDPGDHADRASCVHRRLLDGPASLKLP